MASKSELLEAQGYSRRRLLTAFISGAPGGRELEPAKPLRGVFIGIGLSVAVILVSVFIGFLNKGLPAGWDNGRLVIDTDTGSRYVTVDGSLVPVLNIASARLLLPTGSTLDPVRATTNQLQKNPILAARGISGAPDTLPTPGSLVNTGWVACVADAGTDVRISATATADVVDEPDAALVVKSGDQLWVIAGDRSFALPNDASDSLLRALGLDASEATEVDATWLSLFEQGKPLQPLTFPDAGTAVPATVLRVGDVVQGAIGPDDRYLVTSDGRLAPLTPFAFRLYQQGPGYSADRERTDVTPDQLRAVQNSPRPQDVVSPDWPTDEFTMVSGTPCAVSQTAENGATTALGIAKRGVTLAAGVHVDSGAGALVDVTGFGEGGAEVTALVDATGTSYPVPNANGEDITKLGYTAEDIGTVGVGWIQLLHPGPTLSSEAAGALSDAAGS